MWFTESPWGPIVALLVAAVVLAFLWSRNRRPAVAVAAAVCTALVPVTYLVERSIVTPSEEVERKVFELRDAVVAGDVDPVLAFFSETAERERVAVMAAMNLADVHDDLRITDVDVETSGEDSQAVSHFRANGTVTAGHYGDHHAATRWEVSWRKEAGQWKLYKIQRLNPITGEAMGLLSAE